MDFRFFKKNGYLVLPGVLSPSQIAQLKQTLNQLIDRPDRNLGEEPKALENIWVRYPDLRWLLFHKPVTQVLRQFLGEEFVILRDAAAHRNNFTPWHRDTLALDDGFYTLHREREYKMINVGYYLQNAESGGLEVIPGSHQPVFLPFKEVGVWKEKIRPRFIKAPRAITIPSKAGDAILFDPRIIHRGSIATDGSSYDKLAIFYGCSTFNPKIVDLHDANLVHHLHCNLYLRDFYYPPDLVRAAKDEGMHLV